MRRITLIYKSVMYDYFVSYRNFCQSSNPCKPPARPLEFGFAITFPSISRENTMERFTISLSETLAQQFDELIHRKGYENRSEAVRDLVRAELENFRIEKQEAPFCV